MAGRGYGGKGEVCPHHEKPAPIHAETTVNRPFMHHPSSQKRSPGEKL